MSYCVNCGVELDKSCSICPLCNTRVINPNEPEVPPVPRPYPTRKGTIDPVRRSDVAILTAVILGTTAIVCGLLNFFLFTTTMWSLYVIGACIVLWVFFLPVFFPDKLKIFVSLGLDGISIALYFEVISWLHPGNGWYFAIALPLIALVTLLILIYVRCLYAPNHSILSMAAVLVAEIGTLSVCVELLMRNYLEHVLRISWSAIILTCCVIIDASLFTILRHSRLREEIRRRMHI